MEEEDIKQKGIFGANPHKAEARVTINSFMMGSLFTILAIIWTLNPLRFSPILIAQLAIAIPLLYMSSLAYAKVGYRKETKLWDILGWHTNNLGNIFIFNSVGIMISEYHGYVALIYFTVVILLMLIYSAVNVYLEKNTIEEKVYKFLFFITILFLGGILPIIISR